jgi:hypothetical protein
MLRMLAMFCLGLHPSAATPARLDDVPSDLGKWFATNPPQPGTERWYVANHDTKHEWVVAFRDDRIQARLRTAEDEAPAPLPFEIKQGSARAGLSGRRLSIKVSDGWLVAFNAGEFGAGLWWFSPDGKKRYKIAEAWLRGFVPTESGLLAIEGLAHMNVSEGRILRLTQTPGGKWQSEEFVNLKQAPAAYCKAADGSLIVATTERLLRVVPSTKEVEELRNGEFWGGLYPNSMVITPEGVTYIGMRHGIARIEKKKGGGRVVRWLLPNKAFDEAKMDPKFR